MSSLNCSTVTTADTVHIDIPVFAANIVQVAGQPPLLAARASHDAAESAGSASPLESSPPSSDAAPPCGTSTVILTNTELLVHGAEPAAASGAAQLAPLLRSQWNPRPGTQGRRGTGIGTGVVSSTGTRVARAGGHQRIPKTQIQTMLPPSVVAEARSQLQLCTASIRQHLQYLHASFQM